MDFIYTFFIFIVIVIIYLHVVAQKKKSQDLEIYEMDYNSNAGLQDVCDLKQPVLFRFLSHNPITIDKCLQKSSFDVNVKSSSEYFISKESIEPVALSFSSYHILTKTNEKSDYFTEGNESFIEETGLYQDYKELDDYLKPPAFIAETKYDLWLGSPLSYTPLRYHTNYRQFLYVTTGKIHVKMTPWKSYRYLDPIHDYESYEFWSPISPGWAKGENANLDKIKFLEFDVLAGFMLYLPPYWWYSIQYASATVSDTVIMSYTYNSVMNLVSNIPNIFRHFIQLSRTKRKVLVTIPTPPPMPTDEKKDLPVLESPDSNLPVKLTDIDFSESHV